VNEELISTYQVVRDNVEELISALSQHIYEKNYYYRVREADRSAEYKKWTPVQRASRLMYLNKTCFNGLYRVNSKGQFNVPFGKYTNPTIVNSDNLRACSVALRKISLHNNEFLLVETQAQKGDFVYFDPPYHPLSETANFTTYSQGGFNESAQTELRNLCFRLNETGVKFMLSNSSAPLMRELYHDFRVEEVHAGRAINSNGSKRGQVIELIIRNF